MTALLPSAGPDRTPGLLPLAGPDRTTALYPPADPDRTPGTLPPAAPFPPAATLLLSSQEMFHRLMAAPWVNRPPARAVPTRRP
ncbi:hypothetical protein SAMN06272735_7886 [Streptomyces sp. TLI_55]|uniref:hypothetical protein n=1 Tax=Streptomyces sp. TLI_55 TaxID=1938861 RepID=UPI000BDAF9A4|nr:hypothetical protein [Streptomyces sp. TLI_55]SNX66041.1 hypothetical protein SAMN06272735_7886 [Streptomyces sp. TLI_55]